MDIYISLLRVQRSREVRSSREVQVFCCTNSLNPIQF